MRPDLTARRQAASGRPAAPRLGQRSRTHPNSNYTFTPDAASSIFHEVRAGVGKGREVEGKGGDEGGKEEQWRETVKKAAVQFIDLSCLAWSCIMPDSSTVYVLQRGCKICTRLLRALITDQN